MLALDERVFTVRIAVAMTAFAAPDFSRFRNANLGQVTLDRLMMMLAALAPGFGSQFTCIRPRPKCG